MGDAVWVVRWSVPLMEDYVLLFHDELSARRYAAKCRRATVQLIRVWGTTAAVPSEGEK